MEMRIENFKSDEKLRKEYEDNLQGYIFIATENNKNLVISENGKSSIICNAKDFWKMINIDVMDIESENPKFKKCIYIGNTMILEYDNRIIKIKIAK